MVVHPCAHHRNETIGLVLLAIGILVIGLFGTDLRSIFLADWWRL
jgi:hypothetical protein